VSRKKKLKKQPDRKPELKPEKLPSWPAEFAPPPAAAIIIAAAVLLSALIFVLSWMDYFSALKLSLAGWLHLFDPRTVKPGGADMAMVLWFFVLIGCGGLIHPAIGVIVMLLFRPWLDGYTYPTDNIYFVWAIFYLATLWSVQSLFRGRRLYGLVPLALIGGYLVVGLATAAGTVQYDATCRSLLLFFSYFALFMLTISFFRSRGAIALVITGICCSMAAQALFSILHFEYLLPYLRKIVQDPRLLMHYFGMEEMTPELARRFMINRAFGSLLFPNALAAFLILGLPMVIMGAITGWTALLPRWGAGRAGRARAGRLYQGIAAGLTGWLVATVTCFACLQFPVIYRDPGPLPWYMNIWFLALCASLAGLAVALPITLICVRRGLITCGLAIQSAGMTLLAGTMLYSLYLTYSRGGMLAFLMAMAAMILLLCLNSDRLPAFLLRWAKPAAALLLITILLLAAVHGAGPAAAQEALPPSSEVTEEGMDFSTGMMLDPASFRLRITYWNVSLRMFLDHWLTGVGMGNFGPAYAKYQFLGAGDVRLAHNCYLQAFCETGFFGGLFLAAFCAWFTLAGAWRIIGEEDRRKKCWLAGLWAGVLAFMLHAGIDINYYHPSLVMFWMVFAGLFLALAYSPDRKAGTVAPDDAGTAAAEKPPAGSARLIHGLVICGVLLSCALCAGIGVRIYLQDLSLSGLSMINVKNDDELKRRLQAGGFFLGPVNDAMKAKQDGRKADLRKLYQPVRAIECFLPGRKVMEKAGRLYVPVPGGRRGAARPLREDEALPDKAILVITNPEGALTEALKIIDGWLRWLETIDSNYPHSPELALHLSTWYSHLTHQLAPALREDYTPRYLYWAGEAVRRSPMHSDLHVSFSDALWTLATLEETPEAQRSLLAEESVRESEKAVDLAPVLPQPRFHYADALDRYSNFLKEKGREEAAAEQAAHASEARKTAEELRQARWNLGFRD
jgi:hypothetical protein